MRRPLVVLGAHHSGGDLLAAALARCGARPVARGRVQAACEALVSGNRVDWPAAAGAPGPQLLEDPRLCLLLPAVRRYLEDPVCIHVYADPTDLSRDGLALWESYNASALHASEGLPRVFVSRSELLARPRECLDALLAALAGLGIEGLAMPGDPGIPGEPPGANARTATNLTPAQERMWRQLVSGGPGPAPQAPNDQVGELKSKNRAQAREIEILNQRIAWLDAQVLEIQASRSWRITAPLRAIATKLRDVRAGASAGKRPLPRRSGAQAKTVLGGKDTFVLYRIIGNDLHPRHKRGQALENLEFILAHEPPLDGCEKRFVLNRLLDPEQERAIVDRLEHAGLGYLRIPFDPREYARMGFDTDALPAPDLLYGEAWDALDEAGRSRLLCALYRHKNNYAMNNNGARNAALEDGRARAKWIMPWDGNCFLTAGAWEAIRREVGKAPGNRYFVVPMARMQSNQQLIEGGAVPEAVEEPQVIFRSDAGERFDPGFCYGRRPKVELLWRLGVPGPWDAYPDDPWDPPRPPLSADAAAVGRAGWVARLSSGMRTLEANTGHAPLHRGLARSGAILATLRHLDARLAGADSERPTSLRPEVLRKEVAAQDAPPLKGVVDALLRAADEVVANPDGSGDASLQRAFDESLVLALAWSFTTDDRHARAAAAILGRVVDAGAAGDNTNPHYYLDAVRILEAAGFVPGPARVGLREWLARRLDWLSGSPEAISDRRAADHRGPLHDLHVASIAAFLDEQDVVYGTLARAQARIRGQFEADGRPRCAEVAGSMHRACLNLQAWVDLAELASRWGVDLWRYRAPDGAGLGQAVRWLMSQGDEVPRGRSGAFDRDRLEPIRFAAAESGDTPMAGAKGPSTPYLHRARFPSDCGVRPFWNLGRYGAPERDVSPQRSDEGPVV